MNQKETVTLAKVLYALEHFSYANSHPITVDGKQQRADEFIEQRTKLWRETYITPPLRQIVERYAAKHRVNLNGDDIKRGI